MRKERRRNRGRREEDRTFEAVKTEYSVVEEIPKRVNFNDKPYTNKGGLAGQIIDIYA